MFRDGRVVGPRVAAYDRGPREALERQMVHAREERLDHPEAGRPRRQVRRQLGTEARAHEDVRQLPGGRTLGRRHVL